MSDPDIALLRTQSGFEALRKKAEDLEMRGCCDSKWWGHDRDGWKEAVGYHREMTRKYPQSGRAWFNLGYTSLQARDFATAIDAFNRCIALGYRVETAAYNIGCAHALQGQRDAAFDWLGRARRDGFDLGDYLAGDDDLDSLHDDPRWEPLLAEVGAKKHW
jgi:tetratricopeptide (TPR) repeat protein